jgi:hypothetical protein
MMPLFTWEFWKATLMRGIRTFAEGILIYIGGDAVNVGKLILSDINWLAALSAGVVGFIVAILLAVSTGIPEAPKKAE